jgi:hypothetical protein
MKLVTVLSTAAFVLVPAVAFAEEPGNTKDEPGIVQKAIGALTGSSTQKEGAQSGDKKEGAQNGDKDSNAQSVGNTNYPDIGAVKKINK